MNTIDQVSLTRGNSDFDRAAWAWSPPVTEAWMAKYLARQSFTAAYLHYTDGRLVIVKSRQSQHGEGNG